MTTPHRHRSPAPYRVVAKALPHSFYRDNIMRLTGLGLLSTALLCSFLYSAGAADIATKPAADKTVQKPGPQALKKAAEAVSKVSQHEKAKSETEKSEEETSASKTSDKPETSEEKPAAAAPLNTDDTTAPDVAASEEPVYLDDRSTPQKLIESYYNAINRKEYARAFGYYAEGQYGESFDQYAKGYQGTQSVTMKLGTTQPDPGAGQIYWTLPIAIEATLDDGKAQVYTGCYTISMSSPAMQTVPPFKPMSIMAGTLSKSPLPLDKSVPEECGAP